MKEFPNNWSDIYESDDDDFGTCTYDQFMFAADLWELNSSHVCILRCENKRTGKVKEYSYQRMHAAAERVRKLVQDTDNVVTMVTDESIYQLQGKGLV